MFQIVDYSEKAFALTGDTRQIKDELKAAGGRFNPRLSCGAGWIFSKKATDAVRAIIDKADGKTAGQPDTAHESESAALLEGARVYVSTYRKYASGNLEGAWLTLKDYAGKREFLAACKKLHKDEPDPEFMFQDWENVPSWMISESSIDEEVWHQQPEPRQAGAQSRDEIRTALEKALTGRAAGELDYYVKNTAAVLVDGDRVFRFEKPAINTRFCHPDEPEAEVRAWRKATRTYEFFEGENLEGIDNDIYRLEHAALGDLRGAFIFRQPSGLWDYGVDSERYYLTNESAAAPMTEGQRAAILGALRQAREAFQKRLRAWWKKYGADKLHCWTYWQDA